MRLPLSRAAAGFSLIAVVFVIALLVALGAALLPSRCRSSETANRVKCASNERQIGQALLIFAKDHQGKYPDRLEDLFAATDGLSTDVFVCPSSNDESDHGGSRAGDAQSLSKPHHLSYIYLARGLTTDAPPETPLLYERLEDHDLAGANVLYADGHVEFALKTEVEKLIPPATTRP